MAGVAADFFVLVADKERNVVLRLAVAKGTAGGVGIGEVVNARGGVKVAAIADAAGLFSADKIEFGGEQVVGGDAQVVGKASFQAWGVGITPKSEQFFLGIDGIIAALHVSGKGRDGYCLRQNHEVCLRLRPVVAAAVGTSGDGERTVKPSAENGAAVNFDVKQAQPFAHKGWLWFQAQGWRIVVGADDAHTLRQGFGQCKGAGGAVVAVEEITAARHKLTAIVF